MDTLEGISGIHIDKIKEVTSLGVRLTSAAVIIIIMILLCCKIFILFKDIKQRAIGLCVMLFLSFILGFTLYFSCINARTYIGTIQESEYKVDKELYKVIKISGNSIILEDN